MPTTREAPPTLQSLTSPELIFPRLAGADRVSILRELASLLADAEVVTDAEALYRSLEEREALGSTGIGSGVAVPHCKVKKLDHVVLAVGIAARPIEFEAVDGLPVQTFFVVLSPHKQPAAHLQSLAAISRWVKIDGHLEDILAADGRDEIYATLRIDDGVD